MAAIEKRISNDGTIKYRVKVRIKGQPVQTETFTRLTDAKRWAQRTEAAILDGRHFPTNEARKHTVSDLIDRYVEEVLPRKPKMRHDQSSQLRWWKKEIGCYLLSELGPAKIVQARDKLIQQITRRGKKMSPASANRYLAALSHAFTIALEEWQWVESNPLRRVKKFKEPRGRTRFLSEDELKLLLKVCKESGCNYLYLVVTLAVSTGMRYSEILNLTWPDVNLKDQYLILNETKNGSQRRVPLHSKALELFKAHNRVRRIDTALVFPGVNPQRPMDTRSAWKRARDKAGIEDFRFHDLRHSAASFLAMDGATTRDIAEVLGHKTLQMVKRYSHLADSHTSEVVAKMNEKVFSQLDHTA